MTTKSFILKSREEVVNFEKLLGEYTEARTGFHLPHIPLVKAYDIFQKRENGGREFTALLDIQINFILLYCDSMNVGAIWNDNFSKGKLEGGSILDSQAKFFGKMDIHRFNSSFILRYRALWDKIMGLILLLFSPQDYERFCQSKSKRKFFKRIINTIPDAAPHFGDQVDNLLTDFDNKFRTPEAHGTGMLRKWSFLMEPMHENPQIDLIDFWNAMNQQIINIGKVFDADLLK
jgi:hypothetical protein